MKKRRNLIMCFFIMLCSCTKTKDIQPGTYFLEKNICNELLNIDVEASNNLGGSMSTKFYIDISAEPIYKHRDIGVDERVYAEFEDAYIEFELTANGSEENHKVYLDEKGSASIEILVSHKLTSNNKTKYKIVNYGGYVFAPLYKEAIVKFNNIEFKYYAGYHDYNGVEKVENLSVDHIRNVKTWYIPEYINICNRDIVVTPGCLTSGGPHYFGNMITPRVKHIIFEGNIFNWTYDLTRTTNLEIIAFRSVEGDINNLKFILPEGNIDFYVDTSNDELMDLLASTYYVGNIYPYKSLNLEEFNLNNK